MFNEGGGDMILGPKRAAYVAEDVCFTSLETSDHLFDVWGESRPWWVFVLPLTSFHLFTAHHTSNKAVLEVQSRLLKFLLGVYIGEIRRTLLAGRMSGLV